MKLIIVSTFYNAEKFITQCIQSIQSQTFKEFVVYLVDDCSTDSSYENAKIATKDDQRFIIIKQESRQYKLKNFVDVIRDNPDIKDDDVIVELDGDDLLSHPQVLEKIYNVYLDPNIWISNSRHQNHLGNPGEIDRADLRDPRMKLWTFGPLRVYRAFLFRQIKDEHLKINGEYLTISADVACGLPMLEMAGEEHYWFFDEVMYIYNMHENGDRYRQEYVKGIKLSFRTKMYIYLVVPQYKKLDRAN